MLVDGGGPPVSALTPRSPAAPTGALPAEVRDREVLYPWTSERFSFQRRPLILRPKVLVILIVGPQVHDEQSVPRSSCARPSVVARILSLRRPLASASPHPSSVATDRLRLRQSGAKPSSRRPFQPPSSPATSPTPKARRLRGPGLDRDRSRFGRPCGHEGSTPRPRPVPLPPRYPGAPVVTKLDHDLIVSRLDEVLDLGPVDLPRFHPLTPRLGQLGKTLARTRKPTPRVSGPRTRTRSETWAPPPRRGRVPRRHRRTAVSSVPLGGCAARRSPRSPATSPAQYLATPAARRLRGLRAVPDRLEVNDLSAAESPDVGQGRPALDAALPSLDRVRWIDDQAIVGVDDSLQLDRATRRVRSSVVPLGRAPHGRCIASPVRSGRLSSA